MAFLLHRLLNHGLYVAAHARAAGQFTARHMRPGARPGLFIVGAQKAGTTSLYRYLNALPEFSGAQRKEVRFFHIDDNYRRGDEWYEGFFNGRRRGVVHFEATPEYLYFPVVPERLYRYNPHANIVAVLREPIARAYSAWNMYCYWAQRSFIPLAIQQERDGTASGLYDAFLRGTIPRFSDYIDLELRLMARDGAEPEPGILRRGLYAEQIERYLRYFDSSRVLVLGFNELALGPDEIVNRISRFARGESLKSTEGPRSDNFNRGAYAGRCSPADVARLEEFYRPHNERLWNVLGRTVDW